MAPRQPPIQITRATRWPWLEKQVESRTGPVAVLGAGHHARRLLYRLFHDRADLRMQVFTNDHDYLAVVEPDGPLSVDLRGRVYVTPMRLVGIRQTPLTPAT